MNFCSHICKNTIFIRMLFFLQKIFMPFSWFPRLFRLITNLIRVGLFPRLLEASLNYTYTDQSSCGCLHKRI